MQNDRRYFIKIGAGTLFFGTLIGTGSCFIPKLNSKTTILRPPGALDEKEFLSTCIKCGQCVQVCPYHSLSLLDINYGNSIGTPHLSARDRGCYLCDLLPCVLACPSGSLNHDVIKAEQVKMGVAILKNPNKCLSLLNKKIQQNDISKILTHSNKNDREQIVLDDIQKYVGKSCTICADMCPYPNKEKAIGMVLDKNGNYYPEIRNECVGCGVCEELCPVQEEAAIVILPRVNYEEIYS
ncbi:4Fe-4S dicluster domain-containing protein [Aliarcobacter butzleri]|uniref:4Fe-4S dicluster domain-containing protein n=1 Tax=Aliarcobacter butzleri TaxID=28197 RepID=A0AAW7QDJ3_9BACT|nr:4Fe-4S dicluster domain-containing protein [Aliarcobacter butzleri]MCP3649449.1 4Fe-4S dicluster domain-containing protein [Arcobacter sp. DNRA7]MCR1815622.1 4Fe-4S dicluster domain-containing protein [Aliarcobacter butzleri]MDN5107429.1 4Fe-4S dicluster domain-containing protein [Aliarcobacter butzleri]MDN5123970.1 4Fe-4S dicluster domain-containing protein [Aliarcobacter butzleri]